MNNVEPLEMIPHTQEVFDAYEKASMFDVDINPEPWDVAIPVRKDFPYIPNSKL